VKPPRFPSLFEALVNGIACQQVSLDVGITLLNRLAGTFGEEAGGHRAFPLPGALASTTEGQLRALGFSAARSRALLELAERVAAADELFIGLETLDDAAAAARLEQLRGVGRWTAEYALLRGLGRLDVFPGDDVGARRRLERWLGLRPLDYAGVRRITAQWQPWAGMVYFHLLLRGLAERGVEL
jgi:DNA-3-methyladenine glycosylase II